MMRGRTYIFLAVLAAAMLLLGGCGKSSQAEGEADAVLGDGREVLRIVSGSENAELEPLLEKFAGQENIRIELTYQGSLDIMRLLGEEEIPYDAVWPASSLWLNVGAVSYTHLDVYKRQLHLGLSWHMRPGRPGGYFSRRSG